MQHTNKGDVEGTGTCMAAHGGLSPVPSGRWLECEGGVISGLFNEP
jgi:hypothetical protein